MAVGPAYQRCRKSKCCEIVSAPSVPNILGYIPKFSRALRARTRQISKIYLRGIHSDIVKSKPTARDRWVCSLDISLLARACRCPRRLSCTAVTPHRCRRAHAQQRARVPSSFAFWCVLLCTSARRDDLMPVCARCIHFAFRTVCRAVCRGTIVPMSYPLRQISSDISISFPCLREANIQKKSPDIPDMGNCVYFLGRYGFGIIT